MKRIFILIGLLHFSFFSFTQINPCVLTGASVYVDHNTNPPTMNASVNGVSQYSFSWSNNTFANQTTFYPGWCVTIVDLISGCDTTICENCVPIPNNCPCPFIYMPVCGCDGVMYSNYCLAECVGVGWTPAISNGMPGGFLPCAQPNSCEVEINGDSILCNLGTPTILSASPSNSSSNFISYYWTNGQSNSSILTVTNPGTYCVVATDSTGCVDTACFTVSLQEIEIYSIPNPPEVCLGDSIVMEIDPNLNNIIWNSGDTTYRVVYYPVSSAVYIIEAIDSNGCERRGEILVEVDSCINCIDPSLINPNIICPAVWDPVCGCDGVTYGNDCEALNWFGVTSWITGPCPTLPPCSVSINNGALDIEMCSGDTVILDATPGFDVYFWNTNDTTASIEVVSPGIYTVIATDIANNCVDMDSIQVVLFQSPPLFIDSDPSPAEICLGDTVVLEASIGFSSYFWNNGSSTQIIYDSPTINTWYFLEAEDFNGCVFEEDIWVYVDSCLTGISNNLENELIIFPNPTKDYFSINGLKQLIFDLKLINNIGQEVYVKNNNRGIVNFDVTYLPKGVYIVQLISKNNVTNRRLILE